MNALSEFVNMDKIDNRYVIQYFHLKGLSPTNIKTELESTLGQSAVLFTTIKYCLAEFKQGRMGCQEVSRYGRYFKNC